MDKAMAREVLRVVQPAAVNAAVDAARQRDQQHNLAHAALQRDLEAARYTARRAQKQFDAADPEIWSNPQTDARLKKRIVRTVLQEAVVDVDDEAHEVVLTLHWQGGVHTELRLPRRRRGTATRTSSDALDAVRILARVCADEAIAGFLNRNNLPTGRGNRWIKERVTALRSLATARRDRPRRAH